ncbi:MAG: hypothetical protein ACRYGI_14490 [Janthinobacterium lividum]
MIDNKQQGGVAVTALHSEGMTQTIGFTGNWPAGVAHEIGVKNSNYAKGITANGAACGRNLFVVSSTLHGVTLAGRTLAKVDWDKMKFPVAASRHDVCIGGYFGVLNMTAANTAGLRATNRGCFYLHNSAITGTASNGKAIRDLLTTIVPLFGNSFIDEAGTNGVFDTGNLWDQQIKSAGISPSRMILNVGSNSDINTGKVSATSVAKWMDRARSRFGNIPIAIVITPGGDDKHLNADFGTDPYFNNQRALEAYGARASDDVPASNWNQTAWSNLVMRHIIWARAKGIPFDLILSPGVSKTFMEDTQKVFAALLANNAMPDEIDIENYGTTENSQISSESDPESLNAVALWIAQHKPTT